MSSKKCNVNCCVYGCHSKKGPEQHLSFHRFPTAKSGHVHLTDKFGIREKIEKKKAWEKVLSMGKPASNALRVCSLHFVNEDFISTGVDQIRRHLKKCAVPSCNLPTPKSEHNQSVEVNIKKEPIEDGHEQLLSNTESIKYEQLPLETEAIYLKENEQRMDSWESGHQSTSQHDTGENPVKKEQCNIDSFKYVVKTIKDEVPTDISKSEQQSINQHKASVSHVNNKQCDAKSTKTSNMIQHKDAHATKKLYQCDECNFQSNFRAGVVSHAKIHKDVRQYLPLYLCEPTLLQYKTDVNHANNEQCVAKSTNTSNLVQHQAICSEKKLYQCDECNFQSNFKAGVVSHSQIHKNVKQYLPLYLLRQQSQAKTDVNRVSNEQSVAKSTKTSKLVQQQDVCSEKKRYQCDECNFQSNFKAALVNHAKIH